LSVSIAHIFQVDDAPEFLIHVAPVSRKIASIVWASPTNDRALLGSCSCQAGGVMRASRPFRAFEKCPLSGHTHKFFVSMLALLEVGGIICLLTFAVPVFHSVDEREFDDRYGEQSRVRVRAGHTPVPKLVH
jgi:hypothetical protein